MQNIIIHHSVSVTRSRKGVVLLIVLALMALFIALAAVFMIVTSNARRSAELAARGLLKKPAPTQNAGQGQSRDDCSKALDILLTGGLNNIVGPYSVLENLYGHPKTGNNAPYLLQGTFDDITEEKKDGEKTGLLKMSRLLPPEEEKHLDLLGNVITGLELPTTQNLTTDQKRGDVAGAEKNSTNSMLVTVSSHIERVEVNENDKNIIEIYFRPFVFEEEIPLVDILGKKYIINSPSFSGTGVGYQDADNESDPLLSRNDGSSGNAKPFALVPNILAPYNNSGAPTGKDHLQSEFVLTNPDYTAPDYQTMFLAHNQLKDDNKIEKVIPSFHRPQLVKYWDNAAEPEKEAINLRKYVLRPLPHDHPNFSGSNPAATVENLMGRLEDRKKFRKFLEEGPWDVDNDGNGEADGIWLDAGLPVETDTVTGKKYKPLVSFYVLDMDGRINVNAFNNEQRGQKTDGKFQYKNKESDDKTGEKFGSIDKYGAGFGAAELTSDTIKTWENLYTGKEEKKGRYGADKKPGSGAADETLTKENNAVVPDAYDKGGVQPDWYGYSQIQFDPLGNRYVDVPPEDAKAVNPYLMNPYQAGNDHPFAADDLELLLRSVTDTDYNNLADLPLRDLLGDPYNGSKPTFTKPENRNLLTVRGSEIPAALRMVAPDKKSYQGLYNYIKMTICGGDDEKAKDLWKLLPEEIRAGRKINLNRLALRDDWTTDQEGKLPGLLRAKAAFAQELFYLLVILNWEDLQKSSLAQLDAKVQRLAQWSVNFVDFIDPDGTMTPFVYHPKAPFDKDGKVFDNKDLIAKVVANAVDNPQQNLNPNSADSPKLIWGFEKPEVAITETLAFHNRNVADASLGGLVGGSEEVRDNDFDQMGRPEGSLFVELYRPGNPQRTKYPKFSIAEEDNKLNLAKRNKIGDYVWRLAISDESYNTVNGDPGANSGPNNALTSAETSPNYSVQTQQWAKKTIAGETFGRLIPDRFVWFGNAPPVERAGLTDTEEVLQQRSFYNSFNNGGILGANQYFVIIPRDQTRYRYEISRPPAGLGVVDFTAISMESKMIAVHKSGGANRLNVSEPLPVNDSDAYPEWTGQPSDHPLDKKNVRFGDPPAERPNKLYANGTIPCHRTICLQRLADPSRNYHPVTNPYITVDWNMIDLQVFTARVDGGGFDVDQEPETAKGEIFFASRQWGCLAETAEKDFTNLWDRTYPTQSAEKKRWDGLQKGTPPDKFHTLGSVNDYPGGKDETAKDKYGVEYSETPNKPFLHFPWNDAPLANALEILLVPSCSAARFGVEFFDNGTSKKIWEGDPPRYSNPKTAPEPKFSPYLNNLTALLDYVEVPSPFSGSVANQRNPGKINVNTVDKAGWEALGTGITYETFNTLRKTSGNDFPTEFKAIRSEQAKKLVPPLKESGKTLDQLTLTDVFKPQDDKQYTNPYTVLYDLIKSGNTVTTRSNVFAVWVTVGYFEVEQFDNFDQYKQKFATDPRLAHIAQGSGGEAMFKAVYPDGCVLGKERGLDNGTLKRNRAFYLLDRSIPVGFRRGEKLNSRDIIVRERMLE
ncbi:hypothetical protein FACS189443_1090 [Planctomycetales bacterium]|nr:hypothetical protein FACS189443_1090 [Planctomycetales bacterium]